jgi:hypothetical protein
MEASGNAAFFSMNLGRAASPQLVVPPNKNFSGPIQRIPHNPDNIHPRFVDGPDGRREIGGTPAAGGVGGLVLPADLCAGASKMTG